MSLMPEYIYTFIYVFIYLVIYLFSYLVISQPNKDFEALKHQKCTLVRVEHF